MIAAFLAICAVSRAAPATGLQAAFAYLFHVLEELEYGVASWHCFVTATTVGCKLARPRIGAEVDVSHSMHAFASLCAM